MVVAVSRGVHLLQCRHLPVHKSKLRRLQQWMVRLRHDLRHVSYGLKVGNLSLVTTIAAYLHRRSGQMARGQHGARALIAFR